MKQWETRAKQVETRDLFRKVTSWGKSWDAYDPTLIFSF